jgi:hypothetical protein
MLMKPIAMTVKVKQLKAGTSPVPESKVGSALRILIKDRLTLTSDTVYAVAKIN